MAAVVLKFFDGFLKSRLEFSDLAKQKLGEPKKYWSIDAAFPQVVDDLFDIGGVVIVFRGADDEITLSVDAEIVGSPISDPVCFACLFSY